MQLIEYLELTIDENQHKKLAEGLNGIMRQLKDELKKVMQAQLFHHPFPLIIGHLHQFA